MDDGHGGQVSCGACLEGAPCGGDHACHALPDGHEPNDSTHPTALGDFPDSPDSDFFAPELVVSDASDEDWFRFHVTDAFDIGGNPKIRVQLSSGEVNGQPWWLSTPHYLTVWFDCDGDDEGTVADCGEWYQRDYTNNATDVEHGIGCRDVGRYVLWAEIDTECAGSQDGGTVNVRVSKLQPAMGDRYDLTIEVR